MVSLSAELHATETGLQLYGLLDVGVAHIEHSLNFDPEHPVGVIPYANAAGVHAVTGMFNGGLSASRWGIRGAEDLSGGLKAIFTLDSAVNLPSGAVSNAAASMANNTSSGPNMSADSAISGQIFGRQAKVGIESDTLGSITVGRHQSFFVENIGEFDPMLGSQIFSPIGFSGTYGGGGNTEDSRVDNSVRYDGKFGAWRLGLLYKFGETAGTLGAHNAYQANAVYTAGALGFLVGIQQFNDAFAASNGATLGTLSVTANDTRAYMLGFQYKLDAVTLRAGYEREQLTNPSHPGTDAISSLFGYPVSGAVNVNAYTLEKDLNVYWAGVNYLLTPQINLSGAFYKVDQNDYSSNACATASSKCSGNSMFVSLLADYILSKRTDVYIGYMGNKVSGGMGYKYEYTSNMIVGTGVRHRF